MSLRKDRQGTLWIGTMESGLHKFADGKLTAIPVKAGDAHSVSAAGIMSIFEARDGMIWLGTFGGGANVLDPASGLIRQLPFGGSQPGAISGANVSAIAEDAQGNLWIATDGQGLDLARPDGTRHQGLPPRPARSDHLAGGCRVCRDASMHTATSGWEPTAADWRRSSAPPPPPMPSTSASSRTRRRSPAIPSTACCADAKGRLWVSGNAGLVRFDPDTGAVKTYHREDGLQGEEFNFGAYAQLADGRLCFGGTARLQHI